VAQLWRCGGSVTEVLWLLWRCGGSVMEAWGLSYGGVVAQLLDVWWLSYWRCGGSVICDVVAQLGDVVAQLGGVVAHLWRFGGSVMEVWSPGRL
jgi:hypothetical protein